MHLSIRRGRATAPIAAVTVLLAAGLGVGLGTNPARSIGGLCNGAPASHSWLDASGQPGPTLIDGTDGDDTIVGSDGDDNIAGGPRHDAISGRPAAGSPGGGGGAGPVVARGGARGGAGG